MMEPAVKGTMNVLKACSAMQVHKLIVVSSIATNCFNPDWPRDKIKDESCWSDKGFCRQTEVSAQQLINDGELVNAPSACPRIKICHRNLEIIHVCVGRTGILLQRLKPRRWPWNTERRTGCTSSHFALVWFSALC